MEAKWGRQSGRIRNLKSPRKHLYLIQHGTLLLFFYCSRSGKWPSFPLNAYILLSSASAVGQVQHSSKSHNTMLNKRNYKYVISHFHGKVNYWWKCAICGRALNPYSLPIRGLTVLTEHHVKTYESFQRQFIWGPPTCVCVSSSFPLAATATIRKCKCTWWTWCVLSSWREMESHKSCWIASSLTSSLRTRWESYTWNAFSILQCLHSSHLGFI